VLVPALSITKTADAATVSAGTSIGFTVTVSNSSADKTGTATNVAIDDPLPGGAGVDWSISPSYSGPGTCSVSGDAPSQSLDCSLGNMAPGASASVHVSSATTSGSAGTYPNTATVSADNNPSVQASASITVLAPDLSITKTADAASVISGNPIGFTVTVSNAAADGTGTASAVTISDPLPGGTDVSWSISPAYAGPGSCTIDGQAPSQSLDCSLGDLAPGASASVHVQSSTDAASAGTYDNTASAAAANLANPVQASASTTVVAPLVVSTTAAPTFTVTYAWQIAKSATQSQLDVPQGGTATFDYTVSVSHDSGTASAWQVTGTVTVANPNAAAIEGASVSDAVDNGGACSLQPGSPGSVDPSDATIPGNGSVQFAYTCTYAQAPSAASGTDTAQASFPAGPTSSGTAGFTFADPTIVDGSVSVTDSLGGSLGSVSYTDPSPKDFTYSVGFTGDPAGTCTTHDNTATFTTDSSGTTGSAQKSVKDCVGADLAVTTTATPAFTRTYHWSILKSVNATKVTTAGATATFTYTVTAAESGFADSAWSATGTVTVHNPNDWEAITATVTDAVDNGGLCSVTNGADVPIAAGASVQLAYSCSYAGAPSPAGGTDSATATWSAATYATPHGTAANQAGVAFTTPSTLLARTITPTDAFNGGKGVSLCTLQPGAPCQLAAVNTTPFTTHTYKYSRTVAVKPGTCLAYTNTAVTGLGQSSSVKVNACGLVTVRLYLGYADGLRKSPGATPGSPWEGSPNTNFIGCPNDACPNGKGRYDGGAIWLNSPSVRALKLQSAKVVIGHCTFTPWAPGITLPAVSGTTQGRLILTETTRGNRPQGNQPGCDTATMANVNDNFDTSETNQLVCAKEVKNDGLIPVVTLTINGVTKVLRDTKQILNTKGIDSGCKAIPETKPWTLWVSWTLPASASLPPGTAAPASGGSAPAAPKPRSVKAPSAGASAAYRQQS
jgi:uncharacterized repeat protein (TIGR01451 family)